jgi:GrpB-like predicted nucleotidyltransferase (UPF0157 family)
MAREMTVVDYSNEWPKQYECEKNLLQVILGDVLENAYHIGSTSVPGLVAKPVIDILLEVKSLDRLDALNSAMESIGYTPKGEFGIPGRRYFPKGGDERTHHVHAFVLGDPHSMKHLAFRDYLRTHLAAATEYAAVKMAASAAHKTDPKGYVAFKHAFVEQMVDKAVHWMSKEQSKCSQEEQS